MAWPEGCLMPKNCVKTWSPWFGEGRRDPSSLVHPEVNLRPLDSQVKYLIVLGKPEFTSYSSTSAQGSLARVGKKINGCLWSAFCLCARTRISLLDEAYAHRKYFRESLDFHAIFEVRYEPVSLYKYCVAVIASKLQGCFIYGDESVRLLAAERQLSAELEVVGGWWSVPNTSHTNFPNK